MRVQADTLIWRRGVDLHSGVVEASEGPGGTLRETDGLPSLSPLPPPHTPHPEASPPPPTVSLRVLSAGEEEGSLTAESALEAAALCSPGCRWSTSREPAAPGEEGRLPGNLFLSSPAVHLLPLLRHQPVREAIAARPRLPI